ncbi:MAG TPA: CHAT domain-containing protein [Verrucomicrobiae bacterium]|nr:CHAT domain-containing protein [Verrucomicrobiae bacterium]
MRRLAVLVVLCGCSLRPYEHLDTLFSSARTNLHAGELAKAEAEAERGVSLAEARKDQVYLWRFRLLRSEVMLYNLRAEEVLAYLSDPVPAGAAFRALAARKEMLEGQAHSILGHADQADRLLAGAHQAAEAAGAQDVAMEVEVIQGPILIRRGLYDEAEWVLARALARAQAEHSSYAEGSALINLGMIRLRKHRYDDAAGFFEEASRVIGPVSPIIYSVAQNNLAVCYLNLGEHDRAIRIQMEAIARHERSGAKFYLQGAVGAAGETYLSKGALDQAIPFLRRALSLASELNRPTDAALWATNLSSVYIELGDWRNAEAFNQEAIRLKNSVGDRTLQYNTLNAAQIEFGKGDLDQSAESFKQALREAKNDPAVEWEAHDGLGGLAAKRKHGDEATREFEAAVGVLEKTRSDLLRTEFKLPFLTRRIQLYQEYVDALLRQDQIERALAVADSSHAQVLAQRSESAPVRRLPPGAFLNLARESGSVLLSYWLAPNQSHAWVITAHDIHHVPLPPSGEIEPLVAQYQDAVERQLADPLRTRLTAGEKLYQMLIAPVCPFLPKGAHIVVVPDGALHGLNLESLPSPGESPHYWIQDATIEIAPSLAMWGGRNRAPGNTRRLLLLGDPAANDPDFPPLSQAAREIASVKQNFTPSDQVVLTRDSATPQAYLAAASGPFAAIHFTAHALANRENPLESAVLLSGGKLYARDVMDLPLNADLVTVSACRGAGQRTYSGEGLVGFAWAFLRAGARHVIAGLWDVNDQSTADLMDVLYRELAAGRRPADALRAAKLAMIESRGNLRKPYYWAPFQLYTVAP